MVVLRGRRGLLCCLRLNTVFLLFKDHSQEAAAHCPTDRGEGALGVEPEETEPASKKTALESLLGDPFSKTKHFSRGIEMEIDLYRREASIPLSCCPLKWWRENSCKYPSMSPLAKAYLSIPATSVPSERVFSTAGDIVTAQRSQMLPEIVDMLIFLKKNMTISVFISSLACLEKPENNLISFCLHF